MPNDVAEKLDPKHLMDAEPEPPKPVSEQEMVNEVKEAQKEEGAKKKPAFDPNDPRLKETYQFEFSWKDGRGEVWEGSFISVIPTVQGRAQIGAMRARLAGGMPFEAMDPQDLQINFVLAHLSGFLRGGDGDRPTWAKDLFAIRDPELLFELWNTEVALHDATFFGRNESP